MRHETPAPPAALPMLMEIVEAPGLFADALLSDERGSLLFISIWGRDTAVQELLARMSVSLDEGGIRALHVKAVDGPVTVHLDRMPCMEKHSGRMPPRNLFGDLVQLWVYDRLAVEPDRANRRALLLYQPDVDQDSATDDRIWQLVRDVCHLPLLDAWRDPVLALLQAHHWMQKLEGRGIGAWRIDLGDPKLEAEISRKVRALELMLGNADTAVAVTIRQALAA
jgi:hypothetical protein